MINLNEVADYISQQSSTSKVYIGGDSYRVIREGRWFAEYTIVIVVHKDGKHSCRSALAH